MLEWLLQPWPWYVAGPIIGLMVPALLLLGNKQFGISSSLRHVCASCVPANIPFLNYDWRSQLWNLWLVVGIVIGGFVGWHLLTGYEQLAIAEATQRELAALGVTNLAGLVPPQLFGAGMLASAKGLAFLVAGGFLIGFGTRYAGGCTSGHAIMGLSNLQWPSLVAVIGFFIGGLTMTHLLFPALISWLTG
jgi:hypothetical protein